MDIQTLIFLIVVLLLVGVIVYQQRLIKALKGSNTKHKKRNKTLLATQAAPSNSAKEVLDQAKQHILSGDFASAKQLLQGSIDKEPSRSDLRLLLLGALVREGNNQEFEDQFDKLSLIGDQDALNKASALRLQLPKTEDELTQAAQQVTATKPPLPEQQEATPDPTAEVDLSDLEDEIQSTGNETVEIDLDDFPTISTKVVGSSDSSDSGATLEVDTEAAAEPEQEKEDTIPTLGAVTNVSQTAVDEDDLDLDFDIAPSLGKTLTELESEVTSASQTSISLTDFKIPLDADTSSDQNEALSLDSDNLALSSSSSETSLETQSIDFTSSSDQEAGLEFTTDDLSFTEDSQQPKTQGTESESDNLIDFAPSDSAPSKPEPADELESNSLDFSEQTQEFNLEFSEETLGSEDAGLDLDSGLDTQTDGDLIDLDADQTAAQPSLDSSDLLLSVDDDTLASSSLDTGAFNSFINEVSGSSKTVEASQEEADSDTESESKQDSEAEGLTSQEAEPSSDPSELDLDALDFESEPDQDSASAELKSAAEATETNLAEAELAADSGSLTLEMNSFEAELAQQDAEALEQQEESDSAEEDIVFADTQFLAAVSDHEPAADEPTEQPAALDPETDFDLDSDTKEEALDLSSTDSESTDSESADSSNTDAENTDTSSELDSDELIATPAALGGSNQTHAELEALFSQTFGQNTAGGYEEAQVNLELAEEYLRLGERSGASELLEEVLLGGSNEQKDKAKALLARIDN